GLGGLLRPGDLFRQRRIRQRVSRLALGSRRRRARAPGAGVLRSVLVEQEGHGGSRGPERRDMRGSKRARWGRGVGAAAALVLAATAAARTHSAAKKGPIVIGWAHDSTGPMAPFDGPALAAAQLELKKINKKNVLGRKIVLKTCDTQSDNAAASKACADQLISEGAKIILTTCDVNLAGPVVQESAIKNHLLTVAPCIGTDQLGPKFPFCGGKDLCFSFGNL